MLTIWKDKLVNNIIYSIHMSFPCSNVLRLSECVLLFLIFEFPIFILVYAREVMSWRVCLQLLEKFGDITGVIINYNSKDRQFNGYNTTQKTKNFSNTRTTKKPDTLWYSGREMKGNEDPLQVVASAVWVLFEIGCGMQKRRDCGYSAI